MDAEASDELGRRRRRRAPTAKGRGVRELGRASSATAMRSASRVEAEKRGETARPSPAQRFVETAYWNPSVVTDKDGKARVKFRAPMALSRVPVHRPGRHRGRHAGRPDDRRADRPQGLLRRPQGPRRARRRATSPRFIAQVHHSGVTGTVELRLTIYAGGREQVYPEDDRGQGRRRRRGPVRAVRGPRRRERPADAHGRRSATAKDELVAEVPIRPWGVQAFASASGTASDDATVFVGLPPGRAYESPEMLVVVSPTRAADARRAGARDASSIRCRATSASTPASSRRRRTRRPTARRDLLAATSALTLPAVDARRVGRARGAAADRADPRAGRRADRRCRTRTAAGRGSAAPGRDQTGRRPSDRDDLGAGRLGARLGRAARAADRRQGRSTRPPRYLAAASSPRPARRDHETRAMIAARPEHPRQGDLRAGQQPEPAPPGPLRRRARVPGADVREPRPHADWPARSSTSSARGPRPSRRARASRRAATGPAQSQLAVQPRRRRDDRAGRPGFARVRPAGPRARRGGRLAAGPPPGHRLAAAQGQGAGARRPGRLLRQGRRRPRIAIDLVVTVNDTEVYRSTSPARPRARPSSSRARRSRRRQEPRPVRRSRGGGRSATPSP